MSDVLKLPDYFALNIPSLIEFADALIQLGTERYTDNLLSIFDAQKELLATFDIATILLGIHFGADDYHKIHASEHLIGGKVQIIIAAETVIHPAKKPLNELQKNILKHLLAKDELWKVQTNLFSMFSLPKSKSGIQSLIGGD